MKGFLPAPALSLTGSRWFGLDLAKRESQLAVLDPTRPVQTDWETVLAKVAEKLIAAKKLKT